MPKAFCISIECELISTLPYYLAPVGKKLYTEDHEWVVLHDNIGTVGITDYAQKALGDVVFVELPEVGTVIEKSGIVA